MRTWTHTFIEGGVVVRTVTAGGLRGPRPAKAVRVTLVPSASASPGRGRLVTVSALMSYAAGAGDAFAFSQLGGVFTANMTGSLVMAGLTAQPAYGALLSGAATALGAFLLAVYTASRVAPKGPVPNWRGIGGMLWAVVALDITLLVMVCASPHPGSALRLVMLAASAAAMGAQTAAARRYEPASGVTTTFVTGTLTSIAQDAADGSAAHASFRAGLVVMLVLGALTTSGALYLDLRLGPAVAVVATAAAALVFPMGRVPRPVPRPGAHR